MDLEDKRVMVLRCERYEVSRIKELIIRGLEPWGGIRAFVKPGQKVLLKVNLLMAKKPEEVTTTHPAVVQAITELVCGVGGKVTIGDSPGGPFNKTFVQRIYRRTGMEGVSNSTCAELNWEFGSVERPFSEGKILKTLTLGKFVTDADVIINLPKIKTHGMTRLSGGVKNLFGAIPGLIKVEYHLKMQDIYDFSNVLVDIVLGVAPKLTIIDGIIGMEGEGPSAGKPKELNTLLISPNPFALDVAVSELVRIKPGLVPTIKVAGERGLPSTLQDIQLLGVPLKELYPVSFVSPEITYTAKILEKIFPEPIGKWLTKVLKPRPIFNPDICVQCGDCIRSCPPKVITRLEKGMKVNLNKCIRCFCCQELCPEQAVKIKRPFLGKILFK